MILPRSSEFQIRPLESGEGDLARSLFEQYPFKTAQRIAQSLDPARLNEFYLAGLKRTLDGGDLVLGAFRGEELVAIGGLSNDAWHSKIYEMSMAKVGPWLTTGDATAARPLLGALLESARDAEYRHLSARLDGEDYAGLHAFEDAGFRLMDVSVKFTLPMPIEPNGEAPEGWTLRLSSEKDADWMRELGARAHTQNHFLNDPNLPAEKTHRLWDAWVARCIEGLAYRIYVALDPAGGGRGFVTYLRNRAFAEKVGRNPIILDYIVIDPEARGGGVGPWIVRESLARESGEGFDYCELRTSQHNHAAIGAYEKLGFRICATDFLLHKFFGA